jgi:predicted N-acetyltransferase YhbS
VKLFNDFSFSTAARLGFTCEYEVPDEVFMAVELQPGCIKGASDRSNYYAGFRRDRIKDSPGDFGSEVRDPG